MTTTPTTTSTSTTTQPATAPATTEAPAKPDFKALAEEAAKNPPVPTPPSTLYFKYAKPDGSEFLGSAASAEHYLRKGFTISGEETIDDLATYYAEQAKAQAAAAPASSTSTSDTSSTTTPSSSSSSSGSV